MQIRALEFNASLAYKVEFEEGSKEEVYIRANTLKVIDYIYKNLNRKYPRMDIKDIFRYILFINDFMISR